jgi:uncharacterized protein YdgA (DUF945 family)
MRKTWIAAGAALALLGGAVVGGAALTGMQARKQLQEAARSWPAQWPMVKVVEQRYDRGLFSATHVLTLQFGCDADAKGSGGPLLLTLRQRVRHGPLPGFSGFGAAVVDTELELPEASRKAFGDKPPLTAHTVVGFDGATRTRLAMPAIKFEAPQGGQAVDFQGLVADIAGKPELLRYDVQMPAFTFRGGDDKVTAALTLTNARMQGELRGSGSLWLRPGHGEAQLGAWRMTVAPRAGGPEAALALAFDDLKVVSDNTLDKELLGSTARLSGRGMVNGFKIDKLEMQASFKRLHAPSYERLLQRFMDTGATACGMQQAVSPQVFLSQLQEDLGALLPFNPEYALDKLLIEADGKRAEFSYAVGIEGATADDAKLPLPALAMSKGRLRGEASLPLPWVERAVMQFGGAAGQPADAAAQAEMVNVMLAKLTGDGFIVRDGEQLKAKVSLDKGQVLVNGKPVGGRPAP